MNDSTYCAPCKRPSTPRGYFNAIKRYLSKCERAYIDAFCCIGGRKWTIQATQDELADAAGYKKRTIYRAQVMLVQKGIIKVTYCYEQNPYNQDRPTRAPSIIELTGVEVGHG